MQTDGPQQAFSRNPVVASGVDLSTELFPANHKFSGLSVVGKDAIAAALQEFDLTWIWRSDKYEPERSGIRTCLSKRDGIGADIKMPYAVSYLASVTGGKVYLPREGDPTLAKFLDDGGFLPRGYALVSNFDELRLCALRSGRRVYGVDDLGAQRDDVAANSQVAMDFVNTKSNVRHLAGRYAPPEHILRISEYDPILYSQLAPSSGVVYLKTCTGEGGGVGVIRAGSQAELDSGIQRVKSSAQGDPHIIIQPEIKARNYRFQVFLDPKNTESIPVVSLTEQIVATDGIRYTGSKPIPLTSANLEPVGGAIVEFVTQIRNRFPEAIGFASCDFFHTDDGRIILFDPALRPTGNTASFMLRLELASRGLVCEVTDYRRIQLDKPGLPFEVLARALGNEMNPQEVLKTGRGILPWGYNQYQGEGVFMVVGRDSIEIEALWDYARITMRDAAQRP